MRVLLVEDSSLLAKHLLEQLSAIPAVQSASVVDTEQQAVVAVSEQSPDLIILDLHLRQGTGFGVLSSIKNLSKPPVAIVLTNYALPQYRERASILGARYFLDKSSEFDRLPDIITELSAPAAASS